MPQNTNQEYPFDQIYRKDGNGVMFEVLLGSTGIDKIALGFSDYDKTKPKGQRRKNEIIFYLDIFQAALIANDILSGRYPQLAAKMQKDNPETKYHPAIISIPRGKNYGDKVVSRVLSLNIGSKFPWILKAEEGKGNLQASGIISPAFGSNPDTRINVPFDNDELKQFALVLKECVSLWSMHKFSPAVKASIRRADETEQEQIPEQEKASA